jgi:glycosyltransferase involved in cell wall biosynthesis
MTDRVVTGRFVDQPRVDIVLATRNRAARTWEAVQSVLAQSYEKWRLIVVDDASDQAELRRLENLLPSHNRIQLVRRTRPGGAQAARKTGLSYSRSQLVAFLDCDDLWLADKLQRQVALVLAHGGPSSNAIVLCGHMWLSAAGTTRFVAMPSAANYLTYDNMSGLLATARALERAGGVRGPDDLPLMAAEELDLFIRLFQTADVLFAPECLALCRDRGEPDGQSGIAAAAYAQLISRHLDFLRESAPSLYERLLVRAGRRAFDSEQYGAATRHFAAAFRIGSMRARFHVLKVVGALAGTRLLRT